MKNRYLIFLLLLTAFSISSCIQDEAPNAECDIISVDEAWLEENKDIISGKPIITNNLVKFNIKDDVEFEQLKDIEPIFNLTAGANIKKIFGPIEYGDDGIIILYRTFSEDGVWDKDYKVIFIKQVVIPTDKVFSFEEYSLDSSGKYYTWSETINNTQLDWWASGNPGFKMVAAQKTAEEYPTSIHKDGYAGHCVKLTTCDTGKLGSASKMPIAAGSIFIGEFVSKNAMLKPLEATKFGLQIIPAKPLSFTGYYKYTPGEKFTDKGKNEVEGRRDACAIYAVLFEVDPNNLVQLDGSNITSSDRIVLIAEIQNPGEPTEWTKFDIPFESRNGKKFDYNKLANNEYAIAVVASSSKDGAFFEGAVGSTLFVDEIKIEWENK